jgi:crotonobetainyl-CoA:carnitine CoA-transferase CaiB-like acyl-CoA transferase
VTGILGALVARAQSGRGRIVDIAMTEGSMPLVAFSLGMFFADGDGPARGGSYLNGGIAPYNTYRTSDGRYVSLGALEAKFWAAFCKGVGIEASMDALMPGPHQAEWRARLDAIFASKTRAEWEAFAAVNDCCLEPVLEPRELVNDPQHVARKVFFEMGGIRHLRTPVGHPECEHTLARAPGEDTDAILRDAGFAPEEIAALRGVAAI